MAKTIRNQFDKYLTYKNLMRAHRLSRKGKTTKREVILFDLKKEEYIQWLLEQLKTGQYFETQFISTTYACIKNRGMHMAALDVQKAMKHCKKIWEDYYILKMDVSKYFQNIDKSILINILKRKIKDKKLLNLMNKIIYSTKDKKGLPIGYSN